MRGRPAGHATSRRLAAGAAIAIGLTTVLAPSRLVAPAVAIGLLANPDTLSMTHDRTATVPAPGVLANDVTILGTTAVLDADVTHGTLSLAANGGYTYTPDPRFVGMDAFKYHDTGIIPSNTTTVTITVKNAAPVAVDDAYGATTGVTLSVPAPGVLANDHDADGDSLTANLVDGGGNGSLSLSSTGAFTFKSGGSFTGTRTFTYRVSDGVASSGIATVSIRVTEATTSPTPSPTPRPTPVPTPTPTPAPLPTLPLPTLPLPTLPGATATPRPGSPAPTPAPGESAAATPSRPPGTSPDPSPSSEATPERSVVPGSAGGGSTRPPSGPGSAGGSSGGAGGDPSGTGGDGSTFKVGGGKLAPFGLSDAGIGVFEGLDWAVPALVLTVPGLLLILAVVAQLSAGLLWLPVVRRWLGTFGIGRRRRRQG